MEPAPESRSSSAGSPSRSWWRGRARPVPVPPTKTAPLVWKPRPDMNDHATDPATEAFVAHRNLLFTVGYEMLGSAADAEDVLQEGWLRWAEVDLAEVRDHRAYLVRIVTRQALNRIRPWRGARRTTSAPGCPNRCSPRPMWPRTSSWPRTCRSRSCSSSNPCRRPNEPSSCCVRSSTSATTRSRPRSTRAPTPRARSRTARASTSTPVGRAPRPRRKRPGRRWTRSSGRS